MRLQLVGTMNRNKSNQEHIHLQVIVDTDLCYYVVLDTTYMSPTSISSGIRHAFWFPATPVKAGDSVFLYTGSGTNYSIHNPHGGRSHFFYWGLKQTIWNNTGDCGVLMELSTWRTSKYE